MQDYIKNHTDNLIKKGLAEKEAHEQAKKEWRNTNKDVYDAFKEAEKNYNNYTTTIVNYDQAKTEALKGNFDIVEEMLDADSSAHEKNLVKKQELMESEINELIYKNESLASIRTKANAETVDAEIEHNNKMLLEKRLGLFALQNEIFAQTPQYQEAYKYLSDMGAEAFDENGNLVPAAQAKVDEAKNAVLGWAFNYGDALTELANEGEKAFDENGNLTLAAQKKILDAKVAAGEFSPQYVDALKELADNGERIYDENGNLTVAAQKKVANAYAKINEITPEYVNALKEVAVKGQLEFDKNGELTDAAKKKVDEARTKIDAEQINMIATGKSLASSSKQGFESVEFQGAGANAVLGIVDGAGNRKSVNEVGGVFTKLAKTAINSFKNFLGIKSPSRVFSNMSKWIPKGIVKGINDSSGEAVASIENLSKDLIDSFDTNQLSNALGKMDLAIANEQLRMSADSRIQAEYKVGKAVAELKQEKQPLKATLEANITVANNIDGREAGIALAPIIAEEFEFLQ